jgi:hypothetical protein
MGQNVERAAGLPVPEMPRNGAPALRSACAIRPSHERDARGLPAPTRKPEVTGDLGRIYPISIALDAHGRSRDWLEAPEAAASQVRSRLLSLQNEKSVPWYSATATEGPVLATLGTTGDADASMSLLAWQTPSKHRAADVPSNEVPSPHDPSSDVTRVYPAPRMRPSGCGPLGQSKAAL